MMPVKAQGPASQSERRVRARIVIAAADRDVVIVSNSRRLVGSSRNFRKPYGGSNSSHQGPDRFVKDCDMWIDRRFGN